jgi:hypothetical protein
MPRLNLSEDMLRGPSLEERNQSQGPAKRLIQKLVATLSSNVESDLPSRGRRVFIVTQLIISFLLVMYAVFAPHSIALTQGAYLIAMGAWTVQLVATRRLNLKRTSLDIALFGFFACCVVSSFLSYDPLVSIKGLKSPAFFLAFYFVSNRVRTIRFAGFLAMVLIASCLVNVAYSGFTLAVGRGLKIESINPDGPLANDVIRIGDTIVEADDQSVNTPDELMRVVDAQRGRLHLKLRRKEAIVESLIPRQAIIESNGTGFERLGITTSSGRNFRIMGFYSHYETYAEVLQLIAALAIGFLIAIPDKRSSIARFLYIAIPLLTLTLVLTSTRAALAGLALGVTTIAIANGRRALMVAALAVIVVLPLALLSVERSRGVAFFDPEEGSTAYRLEVWREAFGIIKDNPFLGIGKGSEGKLRDSLGLYDEGRLPPGHFHSTPVQIAVWWGLTSLIFYCSFMTLFAICTWRLVRKLKSEGRWQLRGIAQGGLGALVAFNVSSLAHFNFGDGEVVMAFWLLTGLAFATLRIAAESPGDATTQTTTLPSTGSSDRNQLPGPTATSESIARIARAKSN